VLLKRSFWNGPRFLTAVAAGAVAASLALGLAVWLAPDAEQDRPRRVSAASARPDLGPTATPTAAQPKAGQAASPTATATPRPTKAAATTSAPKPTPLAAATPSAATTTPPKTAPRKATAAPAPKVPSRAAAKAPAAKAPAPKAPAPRKPVTASGPTDWAALNAAIARIPGYRQGTIQWSVTSRYGHYGTTDLATSHIYIAPYVDTSLLDSVARHEYAHVLSVRAYGGDWRAAKSAMNTAFGGSGMTGAERAADCMAKAMGATWLHHTSCSSTSWQELASRLLSGRAV
jgi:hypothetical protein